MTQPLEGIRVIDCGIYHAGPGGAALLGDLGADVIKVEQPGRGDPVRNLTRIGSIPCELPGGRSVYCEGANRNKKSITLNLKTPEGGRLLDRLVERSDVFLTNMRQKALAQLRISYEHLSAINPRIIHATVSAFGPRGPDRDKGGFDYQGQARSGFMYSMGEKDMPPLLCQFGIIDQATAMMLSHQIVTALYMRERDGMGQEVHVSILGTAISLLYFNVLIPQMGGFEVPRHRRTTEQPMRNYYRCGDGLWLMMTLTPSDRHWPPLCEALGLDHLIHDPRFDTDDNRFTNSKELISLLDEAFAAHCRDEWLRIFTEHDLFCCAVNTFKDLAGDPQITENGYLTDLDHPTLGPIQIPGYPGHFGRATAKTRCAAPGLGEHTEEILTELGGCTAEDIPRLRQKGVI